MEGEGERVRELRAAFDHALDTTLEAQSPQEVAAAFSGLNPAYHEALYDLYCQLLQGIRTFSQDEFEAILAEEQMVPRLNALDKACQARGITGLGTSASAAHVRPLTRAPTEIVRAIKADAMRRERETLTAMALAAEQEAADAKAALAQQRANAQGITRGLKASSQELAKVHESSVSWANRQPAGSVTYAPVGA